MGIRIIKEKKADNYTFIDDGAVLEKPLERVQERTRKDKAEPDFRLREDKKINGLKHKSKLTGGHSMQGHSPVYE